MPAFTRSLTEARQHLTRADRTLAAHIERVGPCTLERATRFQPFAALLNSIAHQQLTGAAAKTIVKRVRDRFADGRWPSAATMARARLPALRACGLSTAKALAIRDLAKRSVDGTVPSARVLHTLAAR